MATQIDCICQALLLACHYSHTAVFIALLWTECVYQGRQTVTMYGSALRKNSGFYTHLFNITIHTKAI